MIPVTCTGSPTRSVGANLACNAADTLACCSGGGPDTTVGEITFHCSSIVMPTTTVPAAPAAFAAAGYSGCGRLMALPFNMPPEIGPRFLARDPSLASPVLGVAGVSSPDASEAGTSVASALAVCTCGDEGCVAAVADWGTLSGMRNELKNS